MDEIHTAKHGFALGSPEGDTSRMGGCLDGRGNDWRVHRRTLMQH